MYAKYEYNAGATQANVLADLVLICTGTTDVNSLSASCNKTTTTITSTVAAGWTVHDASASATSQVIKAPYTDNGSAYKYFQIVSGASSFSFAGYETWDSGTHTGTNKNPTSTSNISQYFSTSEAGRFYIFASARFVALIGEYSTNYGSSNSGITVCAEFSRSQPWNTTSSGYPSFTVIGTGECINSSGAAHAYLMRTKNLSGSDYTGANAAAYLSTVGGNYTSWNTSYYFPDGTGTKVYDASTNRFVPFFPLYLTQVTNYAAPIGEISTISDIWISPRNLLAHLETVTKGVNDYIAMKTATGHTILFRKG